MRRIAMVMIWLAGIAIPGPAQSPFAPLDAWKAAVESGDQAGLAKLYSTNPKAQFVVGKERVSLEQEIRFWAGVKASGVTEFSPRALEVTPMNGYTRLLMRVTTVAGGQHRVMPMQQIWVEEADGWKMAASGRAAAFTDEPKRRLPEPAAPNVKLYPEPGEAEGELKAALLRAGTEKKRVIVIFGGNWCYDCHVLDATLRSKEFAPMVEASYVVVHVNIGEEGKDNNDLAARLGVDLEKGVPSLSVLDADGKVVFGQKNGEFESSIKIGPEDIRAFLKKWRGKV